MKLQFSISYRAPFGQSVHVCLRYLDAGGHGRSLDLPMHTDDGTLWRLETTARLLPRQAVRYLAYHYQVEDDAGRLMRREWAAVPRLYCCDESRNYIFEDIWRDLSLQHYLFAVRRPRRPLMRLCDVPQFNRSVIFRVSAPHVPAGRSVALLGSDAALGAWSEKRYLQMYPVGDGDWMLSINAYALGLPVAFKYVVVDDHTHDIVEWERGDNRRTALRRLETGDQLVVYGGNVRTATTLTFHDELLNEDHTTDYDLRELYI